MTRIGHVWQYVYSKLDIYSRIELNLKEFCRKIEYTTENSMTIQLVEVLASLKENT